MATRTGKSLEVEVPSRDDEKLPFGRVGIIAAVGFLLGIAWPRLAGVQLVPTAPTEEPPKAASSADPAPPAASADNVPLGAAPAESGVATDITDRIVVSPMRVTSCQDDAGAKVKECDEPEWAALAQPRLQALAACDGAEAITRGKLSIGFELDFKKNKVVKVQRGKSTTLPASKTDKLLGCAENEFATASLEGVKHQYRNYSVFYSLDFVPPRKSTDEAAAASDAAEPMAASGRATVGWDVALVRAEAQRDAKVVARVLRGTRVVVSGRQGDWYRVKYDAKGGEGWVFRTAIGL